jgi:hypothetical protein
MAIFVLDPRGPWAGVNSGTHININNSTNNIKNAISLMTAASFSDLINASVMPKLEEKTRPCAEIEKSMG